MKEKILNFIGSLIRDIIIQFYDDVVEFTVRDGKFMYKSWIPFSFSVGHYVFLPNEKFYASFSK